MNTYRASVTVRLKIPDPEAVTVGNTVRRMGYPVEDVRLSTRYSISVECGSREEFEQFLGSATSELVNPNKHFGSTRIGRRKRELGEPERFDRSRYPTRVAVTVDGDPEGSRVEGVLRDRYGYATARVSSERVWDLRVDSDNPELVASQLAGEPTYFLANPAFQKARVEG